MAEQKKNIFARFFSWVAKFFKGIYTELKKVTWPNGKQVFNNTVSVLVFCLVIGAVIWLADLGFENLFGLIGTMG